MNGARSGNGQSPGGILGAIAGSIGWSTLEKVGNHGLRFLFLLALARLLAPEAFGLLGEALVVTSLLRTAGALGLETALVQEDEVGAVDFATAAASSGVLALAIVGASVLLGPAASVVFDEPVLSRLVPAVALAPALANVALSPRARLRRTMDFRSLALGSLLGTTVGGGAALAAAFLGQGVWSLAIQLVVDAVVTSAWMWGTADVSPIAGFSRERLGKLLRFGGPFTGEQILNYVNRHADDFVIGVFLGGTALGYYRIAYTGLQTLTRVLSGSLTSVALPVFSRAASDRETLREHFLRWTEMAALLAFPACAGFAAVADLVIPLFFGPGWRGAIPAAQVLSVVAFSHIVLRFSPTVMYAAGRSDLQLRLSALFAAVNVVGFLIGVRWGIVGVAAAYAAQNLLTAPVEIGVLKGVIPLRAASYVEKFWRPALAAAAMAAAVVFVRGLVEVGAGTELTLSLATGGVTYAAALYGCGPAYVGGLARELGSAFRTGSHESSEMAGG